MKRHVALVHEETKPWKCEICGKCFSKNREVEPCFISSWEKINLSIAQ
jgi:hypothetical protein